MDGEWGVKRNLETGTQSPIQPTLYWKLETAVIIILDHDSSVLRLKSSRNLSTIEHRRNTRDILRADFKLPRTAMMPELRIYDDVAYGRTSQFSMQMHRDWFCLTLVFFRPKKNRRVIGRERSPQSPNRPSDRRMIMRMH